MEDADLNQPGWVKSTLKEFVTLHEFDSLEKDTKSGSCLLALKHFFRYRKILCSSLLDHSLQDGFSAIQHILCHGGALADLTTPLPPGNKPASKQYRFRLFRLEAELFDNMLTLPQNHDGAQRQQVRDRVLLESRISVLSERRCLNETSSDEFESLPISFGCQLNRPKFDAGELGRFELSQREGIAWEEMEAIRLEVILRETASEPYRIYFKSFRLSAVDESEYGTGHAVANLDFTGADLWLGTSRDSLHTVMPVAPPPRHLNFSPFYSVYDLERRQRSLRLAEHLLANKEYYSKAVAIGRFEEQFHLHPRRIEVGELLAVQKTIARFF